MTKVLITGHTSGIGKAILENCPSDYEVQGISRATGHDIVQNLSAVSYTHLTLPTIYSV